MAKGKHIAKRSRRGFNKALVLMLSLALTAGGVIGGTVAWLTSAPDPVVNTFTYGDVDIELTETDTGLDGDLNARTNEYVMIPAQAITKDPLITVKADSEELWLFVKLEKSENFDTFMEYSMADGWTELENIEDVFYQHITADEIKTADKKISVIKDDTVTVKASVTKAMVNALDAAAAYPTLSVSAYAVQYAGNATAAEAWSRLTQPDTSP